MSGTPPGWYVDPQGQRRWFDGTAWTEHVQGEQTARPPSEGPAGSPWSPPAAQASAPAPGSAPGSAPGGSGSTGLLIGLVAAAVLLVGGIAVALVLLLGSDDAVDDAAADPDVTGAPSDGAAQDPGDTSSGAPGDAPSSDPSAVPSPAEGSPEQVAQAFSEALFAGECDEAAQYSSVPTIEAGCEQVAPQTEMLDGVQATPSTAEVDGDTATVPVAISVAMGGTTQDVPGLSFDIGLTQVDGEWKVSDVGMPDFG